MTNKAYERAFNVAIKYGFCVDCAWDLDKSHCHECDCYQNTIKVIRDALEKLDAIEESKATVWHDAQNDPPKENGEYLCYYEYFRYGNYNCMYRTMDRGYFFNGLWSGEPTHGTSAKVLAWTELPLYNPPGGEAMNTNCVTYRDSAAEREIQILSSILFEIDKQKELVIENAVEQALTKENSETNVLDDVNGKIEKTSQLANDAMTRFHQKHPEFYAVQECPFCGRMCLYDAVFGVLDDPTRIKYKCEACNREFERENGYWMRY